MIRTPAFPCLRSRRLFCHKGRGTSGGHRSSNNGRGDVSLRFDITKVSLPGAACMPRSRKRSTSRLLHPPLPQVPLAAGVLNAENDDGAVNALARVIAKKDFGVMEIVRQFNLEFIVTRRRKALGGGGDRRRGARMDDLFIIDQHPADEKYNFGTLQQTTTIKS